MHFGTHTWVCSICGQGLTRKSTAIRHNNNLHFGGAMLVRPYEYIIGRLNGKFFESDPSIYKHNKKDLKKAQISTYDSPNHINNRSGFGAVPDGIVHEPSSYGNMPQQQPTRPNNIERPIYHQSNPYSTLQPSHESIDFRPPNTSEMMLEAMSKLQRLGRLLKKYYPPEVASRILRWAALDNKFLDQNLNMLIERDRARSSLR
jgi:hypothetical protein